MAPEPGSKRRGDPQLHDIHIVVGGQYGSEAKGNLTYNLTRKLVDDDLNPMVIRTGGPNAGHTVVLEGPGTVFRLRMVPAGMLAGYQVLGALAEGCEIDEAVLDDEINMLSAAGIEVRHRLLVDSQATLICESDIKNETRLVGRIGSTGKGVGSARANRIMREAPIWDVDKNLSVLKVAAEHLDTTGPVVIEATQGYGLGLHAGLYPKCTSRDVRGVDVLAETGLSPWAPYVNDIHVWVVYRPYPIRVAGDSGPLAYETSWAELGLEPEYTTVTKKVRRVGHWDGALAHRAFLANGGPSDYVHPVFMFFDYLVSFPPEKWADITNEQADVLSDYERDIGAPFEAIGVSPSAVIFKE